MSTESRKPRDSDPFERGSLDNRGADFLVRIARELVRNFRFVIGAVQQIAHRGDAHFPFRDRDQDSRAVSQVHT
jgi:hypothetical protein